MINERIALDGAWHLHHLHTLDTQTVALIHSLCEPVDSVWDTDTEKNTNDTYGSCSGYNFICINCKAQVTDSMYLKYVAYLSAMEPEDFGDRERGYLREVLERRKT